MQQSNAIIPNLDNVETKVFFVNHCDYLLEDFFRQLLIGSVVEDGCVLHYDGKSYDITRVHEVGVILQRDIYMYRLTEYKPQNP